jgi:hypothetical protein
MKRLICGVLVLAACGDGGTSPTDAPILVDAGPGPVDDIDFVAAAPLPPGQWLVANDWGLNPNKVFALDPADLGGAARLVFTARRVWAMAPRLDGSAIAFSSFDPMQEAHFGVTFNDSIQNSFWFDTATRSLSLLAPAGSTWANVNDECYHPSADGEFVYICRRYDFVADGSFFGWRLGRIRIADGEFEFLRPDAPNGPFEFRPQEIPGTTKLLFDLRVRPPATGSTIYTHDLVGGAEVMVRADAWRPNLAPDGRRVLFSDLTDQSRLKTFDLQAPGVAAVPVSPTLGAGNAAWSPDGQTLVYTVFENSCTHLERVTWSGTAWSAPERLRDCHQSGEFITNLTWITVAP